MQHNHCRILRFPEVIARTGLKRSSIYALMQKGTFPKSIPLGIRGVGWLEEEIKCWIDSRVNARGS